jgi:Forkhead domain
MSLCSAAFPSSYSPTSSLELTCFFNMPSPPTPGISTNFSNLSERQVGSEGLASSYTCLDPPAMATSSSETAQVPPHIMAPSDFELEQLGQAHINSLWLRNNYPEQEDPSRFAIGHMSMFQHHPDYNARHIDIARFPSPTPTFESLATSSAYDNLNGLPSWESNPSSHYPPELLAEDFLSHPHESVRSPRWDGNEPSRSHEGANDQIGRGNTDGDPPYAHWLFECLRAAPGHQMVLRDIYNWGKENIPKVREALATDPNTKGWQNSIRHNLSMNQVSFLSQSSS